MGKPGRRASVGKARGTRNAALKVKDLLEIDAEDEDEDEGSEAGGAGEREGPLFHLWFVESIDRINDEVHLSVRAPLTFSFFAMGTD